MSRFKDNKEAITILKKIDASPNSYLIIHYSCESFVDISDGRTPRITSIAIRNIGTGQTESFSMHKTAEQMHINPFDIPKKYDQIERKMLDEYFEFLKENKEKIYLHINMRDINYGFKAIEHRYKVLNGEPYILEDSKKINFAWLLKKKYGDNYIDHPRMENLCRINNITSRFFLNGKEEAEAFGKGEFVRLHQSTLSKVEMYNCLLTKAVNDDLKTKAKWYEIYGLKPQGVYEYCKDQWWIQLLWSILMLVLGSFLG